jgi:hypothetical protein
MQTAAANAARLPEDRMSILQTRILGLPLVHRATGRVEGGRYVRGVARGWIAIGDVAIGPIAIGGVAIGGLALGGLGLGVLPLAGLALGVFPVGGAAMGYVAVGGGAVAWHAALGGLAVARDFALGGGAYATEANTEAARTFFADDVFLSWAASAARHARWLIFLTLLPAVTTLMRRLRGA